MAGHRLDLLQRAEPALTLRLSGRRRQRPAPLQQALHALGQALGRERLEQIVHRMQVKGTHRILIKGGAEDAERARGQIEGQLQAAAPRHLDVEEHGVRALSVHQAKGLLGIRRPLRPRGRCRAGRRAGGAAWRGRRFVVDDQKPAAAPARPTLPGSCALLRQFDVEHRAAGAIGGQAHVRGLAVEHTQALAGVGQADRALAPLGRRRPARCCARAGTGGPHAARR